MSYWKEQSLRLPGRELNRPIHGDHEKSYRLIQRMVELRNFEGGGPPMCTEKSCPEEDHFINVDLPHAQQDLIKDIAASFGFKITGIDEIR